MDEEVVPEIDVTTSDQQRESQNGTHAHDEATGFILRALSGESDLAQNNATAIAARLKPLVPFLIILILKLFFDHLLRCIIFAAAITILVRIRKEWNIQISLKSRGSNTTIFILCVVSTAVFSYIITSTFLISGDLVWKRLMFSCLKEEIEHSINGGFFHIIWLIAQTDLSVQCIVLVNKLIFCAIIQQSHNYHQAAMRCLYRQIRPSRGYII